MKKSNLIDLKRISRIKSFGNSMYPLLQNGDIVYYKQIPYRDIQINDIIITKNNDIYITHRLIYKSEKYFITKGDNNYKTDTPITDRQQIIGKLTNIVRKGRIIDPENLYLIQSSQYIRKIKMLVTILNKYKIEHIILKGLPLYTYYTRSHPRRLYTDCDLLIHPNDYKAVDKILIELGYRISRKSILDTESSYTQSEINYFSKESGILTIFDIHFEPVFLMTQLNSKDAFYPASLLQKMNQALFESKRTIEFKSQKISILSAQYLVIYLALHFFHHNYSGIYRLDLLNKIIKKECIKDRQWEQLGNLIITYKIENYMYLIFKLLKQLYKTPVPDNFLMKIYPKSIGVRLFIKIFSMNSIYNGENKLKSGIKRFILLLILSPTGLFKKLQLLVSTNTIRMILKIIMK